LLPDDEALLAASWLLIDRTVYEIVSVRKEQGMTVRDIATGDRIEVRERTLSRDVKPGWFICARAVPDGEGHQFVGGVFGVRPGRETDVLAVCERGDAEEICTYVAAMSRPPTLTTRESEPFIDAEAVLEVVDTAEATSVLDRLYKPEEPGLWVELHAINADEDIIRARLSLEGNRLTVSANADARLDRVLTTLANELPTAKVLVDVRKPLKPGEMPSLAARSEPPTVEWARAKLEILDKMERRWIDESVPALAGLTPRQAADDPTRVDELRRLIDSFPEPDPDAEFITFRPSRLRELLGLRDPETATSD
jgi:hypothetical protein